MIVLRPDQLALKAAIYSGWNAGEKNQLAVMPTGGGKSVIVSDIVYDSDQMNCVQAVIAHRTELVSQMSVHIATRGIMHAIIGPKNVISDVTREHRERFGRSFINPNARCSVAGIDTLLARKDELARWSQQVSRWTIDEAHHVTRENKWGKGVSMFPNAYGLGVTASPQRADGLGLGAHSDGVFHAMQLGPTMREMIDAGNLCEYQIVAPESDFEIDDEDIAASGDFSTTKMREASKRSHIVGDIVKEYIRWANGKRGITFATDVETAVEIAAQYNAAGIPAAAVSAKTPSATRAEFIRRFRDGRLLQLVNVDLFGEGFDVPAVEVVSMGRPTASLAVYLQQFGRALRLLSGKQYGLVIDHVSNWKRHGLPDRQRYWTLNRRDKRAKRVPDPEEIPLTSCKTCSRPYEAVYRCCPHCGAMPPLPDPRSRSVEMVEGDLMLLDSDTLARMRAAAVLEPPAVVADRAMGAAGPAAHNGMLARQREKIEAQERLTRALNAWAGVQRYRGRDDTDSHRRFYLATGIDILTALAQSRADMDKLATTIEGWI